MNSDVKECLFCGETIKATANKCKHCGEWLHQDAVAADQGSGIESGQVLDLLAHLVEKSLVVYEEDERGVGHYRLLETVRQYSRDRLHENNEGAGLRDRHRDYFLALVEEAAPELQGPKQGAWLSRLETDHENLRAALAWDRDVNVGLRLAGGLWLFWEIRGYMSEGRAFLTDALASAERIPPDEPDSAAGPLRAKVMNATGNLAHLQGDYDAARALYEGALVIYRGMEGNKAGVASLLNNLGNTVRVQGDYVAARGLYEEALTLRREVGDKVGISASLNNLGNMALRRGDYGAARALYEESVAIKRELGDWKNLALSLSNLGGLAAKQGDPSTARDLYEEGLTIFRELGDRHGIAGNSLNLANLAMDEGDYSIAALLRESLRTFQEIGHKLGIAECLKSFGTLATGLETPLRAARLLGAAESLREVIGAPLSPEDCEAHERRVDAIHAALGEETFARIWAEGRAVPLAEVINEALSVADHEGDSVVDD